MFFPVSDLDFSYLCVLRQARGGAPPWFHVASGFLQHQDGSEKRDSGAGMHRRGPVSVNVLSSIHVIILSGSQHVHQYDSNLVVSFVSDPLLRSPG